jgi:hypothetical protein
VVVIQDEFVKKSAQRYSDNNSWALDYTFETNYYKLRFYAAIVPNQNEIKIPVFYMLFSNVIGQRHEDIAIETALSHVFELLRKIRPFAMIIKKTQDIIECNSKNCKQ